jgi:chitinase
MYQFTKLKSDKLQTWIAVGGWEFSDPGPTRNTWSDMVGKKDNRAAFIASALEFMAQYGFQGLLHPCRCNGSSWCRTSLVMNVS